jgi:hypothetical protein
MLNQIDILCGCWSCGRQIRPAPVSLIGLRGPNGSDSAEEPAQVFVELRMPSGWVADTHGMICPKCYLEWRRR